MALWYALSIRKILPEDLRSINEDELQSRALTAANFDVLMIPGKVQANLQIFQDFLYAFRELNPYIFSAVLSLSNM